MSWTLAFAEQYEKRARRFLKYHPELEKQYLKKLQLIEAKTLHPLLRQHPLTGRLSGLHSSQDS